DERYLVIRPRPDRPRELPPGRPAEPKPKPPAEPVPVPMPPADPPIDLADHVAVGRAAFAAGEYGRAAERLELAANAAPDDPLPRMLWCQALFALGKYREATAVVVVGVKRQPDWPLLRFRARDLYRDHPAEFDAHLRLLRSAVERFPDDPALLFLLGHQLW